MRGALGVLSFALFVVSASVSSGCSGSTEEEAECASEQQAAKEFLDANRACQVDEDCGAVDTGCYGYPGRHCSGAVSVNREAAMSATWQAIGRDLDQCMECPGGGVRCTAGMIPVCKDGTCGHFP